MTLKFVNAGEKGVNEIHHMLEVLSKSYLQDVLV